MFLVPVCVTHAWPEDVGGETRPSFGLLSDVQYCDRAPAGSRFYSRLAQKDVVYWHDVSASASAD